MPHRRISSDPFCARNRIAPFAFRNLAGIYLAYSGKRDRGGRLYVCLCVGICVVLRLDAQFEFDEGIADSDRNKKNNMFDSFFKKVKEGLQQESLDDPVCGMQARGGITQAYNGKTYSFCSEHCREQFEKSPEAYGAK